MKCLIFSDSHGSFLGMRRALDKHPDAEVVFFLGDGLSDADFLARYDKERMWRAVRGKCDFRSLFCDREAQKTEEIFLEGKRILATHGDLYQVKYGLENIKSLAKLRKADIVLFGHTHLPYEEYADGENPFYLFNPGTSSQSYGILTLNEKTVLFSHGKL